MKANLIIDDLNLDLTDEENLYKFKTCLEFAKEKAEKSLNDIKAQNLFEPEEKAKDIDVFYFAKSILNLLK